MKKKNICFVSNFQKTFFFEKIALILHSHEINIFWFCFDYDTYSYLKKNFSENNILLLSKKITKKQQKTINDFKLNELIYGDRFLKYQTDWAYDYLISIQNPIKKFIEDKNINFIFGEVTHAHEILIHRLVNEFRKEKTHYLHPQSVRIPNGRFFFLEDEFQSKIFKDKLTCNTNWEQDYNVIKPVRPKRVAQVDQSVNRELSLLGKLGRVKRFFTNENLYKDLPSQLDNKFKRSLNAVKEEINKISYSFINTNDITVLEEKKFVFYTLHMQPEASVDVVGVYYENQLNNIKNIWRVLPHDWYIVVKEHSNAIGNRPYNFFSEFLNIRNSILLNEKCDSHKIIDKSQAMFTVSGTIAYEAALKGKPAFTFSSIFFNKLKNCTHISLTTFRQIKNFKQLLKMAEVENETKLSIEEFSKYLYQRSYEGIVDAPVKSIDWLDTNNIVKVSESFLKFLRLHG